jgi:serine/threonine-protein kinase
MSPEQCKSSADVDHRTDIYSLGCVLFHLLTGKPPFDLESTAELIIAHVSTASPAPSSLVPSLARDLDTVVARCMAKAPRDRYATMQELAAACDALLARPSAIDLTIHAAGGILPRVTVPAEPPRPTRSKRPAIAIWVGGVVLAASGGIAIAIATAGGAHSQLPAAATAPVAATAPAGTPTPAPVATPTPATTATTPNAPPPASAPPAVANVPADAAPETATVAPPASGSNTAAGASQPGKHGNGKKPKPGKGKPSDSGDLYDDR